MKICYCTLGFPPAPGLGGPTLNAYYLTKALMARGHRVTVLCTNLASKNQKLFPETRRVPYEGVDVLYLNAQRLIPLGAHSFGLFITLDLGSFLKRELKNYDVVHLDGYRSYIALVAAYYCRKFGIPHVMQGRGAMRVFQSSLLAKHVFDLLLGRSLLDGCASFIASSEQEVSDFQGFARRGQKVNVIPNGLNFAEYANLPPRGLFRQRNRIVEPRLITYLGRLHSQKGIDHLLRAFAGSRFRDESRLAVIGPDDGCRASLEALAQQLGIRDSVTFVGVLESEEKLQAYVDSDVVVYAGSSESFGMVPFEAAMCGVPAVTAEGSACGQLLTAYGAGFVVPYGDASKLAEVMDGILDNTPAAVQKVIAARVRIKDDLCWEKIAQRYETAYESASRGRRPLVFDSGRPAEKAQPRA
jgi:glycosyltransferase involved in cell wall biosynthesis